MGGPHSVAREINKPAAAVIKIRRGPGGRSTVHTGEVGQRMKQMGEQLQRLHTPAGRMHAMHKTQRGGLEGGGGSKRGTNYN